MNFFIGIDGGGTKTKASLVDENIKVICEEIGGPSNFLVFDITVVAESIVNLISTICEKGNIEPSQIKSVLLGTAGAGRQDDAERLENASCIFSDFVKIKPGERMLFLVDNNSFNTDRNLIGILQKELVFLDI